MSAKTDKFLAGIKSGAMSLWDKFGILPSVAAGQAALESAWGGSGLATRYNNLFGIKGSYQGNSAMMNTWEVYGGKRYAKAIGLKDYKAQIKAIHNAGYATDPDYSTKVISIIEKYGLASWDREVLQEKKTETKTATAKDEGKAIVPYPGKVIKKGSTGKDVECIQRAVKVSADGKFGTKTEVAVKAYQKRQGLTVDGKVGPETWNRLF
ncbi:glucosaminidase domain-containing protein [Niallia sp. FSL R7-0271]|uniref:glucosaminidase domain-containing protein n=1 Tax=Niallia sp. FSL R7-0271 TaxID=2921678 RepID=UPI0030F92DEA